jgi:hypothetical protein
MSLAQVTHVIPSLSCKMAQVKSSNEYTFLGLWGFQSKPIPDTLEGSPLQTAWSSAHAPSDPLGSSGRFQSVSRG